MRAALLATGSAALLTAALAVAPAVASPAAPVAEPPSIAQLCAATTDDAVNALLKGVAQTDLVDGLKPLVSLTVPDTTNTTTLKGDVTLSQVRSALNCTTGTTTTTTTAPPVFVDKDCSDFANQRAAQAFYDANKTSSNPDPAQLDADGDGQACEDFFAAANPSTTVIVPVNPTQDDGSVATGGQVRDVPEGSASTGE